MDPAAEWDPRLEAEGIFFREVQGFRQPWIWALVLIAPVTLLIVFGHGIVQQIVFGEPWGDRSFSDTGLLVFSTAMIALSCLPVVLIAWMKLITEVRSDRLVVRFAPLRGRQIRFDEIVRHEARTYRPIREYGGWGIRYSMSGRGMAYNVSGNRGLQLELSGGKKILIGSQRAEELDRILQERMDAAS